MLGVALLRNGFRPRAGAWLLALTISLAADVLQVTSMGSAALPIIFAFALAGRRLATADVRVQTAVCALSNSRRF